jgi:hypothetical protein
MAFSFIQHGKKMAKRENERLTPEQRGALIKVMLLGSAMHDETENKLWIRMCLDRYGIVDVGKSFDPPPSANRLAVQ